jgi:hypothetical protein
MESDARSQNVFKKSNKAIELCNEDVRTSYNADKVTLTPKIFFFLGKALVVNALIKICKTSVGSVNA